LKIRKTERERREGGMKEREEEKEGGVLLS
jgi:hypothetical protein